MDIKLEGVSVSFPGFGIAGLSLSAGDGSFTSIVGPSGCGKTTVLRVIAGLQPTSSGRVLFSGRDVTFSEPEERNAGFVFQQDSLFTHMSVAENVAFGPRMRKLPGIEKIVEAALATVHLSGFGSRSVDSLSGGERKRVAIARAIASKPAVLLLDEPMNGLDAKLRERMKALLRELRESTGITVILVTHDIDEAFSISDKIVVMNNGSVEQAGTPLEIFTEPATVFVRDFVSDYVIAEGTASSTGGKAFIEGSFRIPSGGRKPGKKAYVNIKKGSWRW